METPAKKWRTSGLIEIYFEIEWLLPAQNQRNDLKSVSAVVFVARTLSRNEGIAEDHRAPVVSLSTVELQEGLKKRLFNRFNATVKSTVWLPLTLTCSTASNSSSRTGISVVPPASRTRPAEIS